MLFPEAIERIGEDTLYQGVDVDAATRYNIEEWFYYRKVVDNGKFGRYFNRTIRSVYNQYLGYLRVETTEFDPMVATYFEQEIETRGKSTGSVNNESGSTNEGTSTTKFDTSRDVVHEITTNTTDTSEGTTTVNNTGTVNTDTTNAGASHSEVDDTENTTTTGGSTTTSNTTTVEDTSVSSDHTATRDNKGLTGDNPDSATYVEGGSTGAMPVLNWVYTSSQTQGQDKESSEDNSHTQGDTETSVTSETTNNSSVERTTNSTSDSTDNSTGNTLVTNNLKTVTEDDRTNTGERKETGTNGTTGTDNTTTTDSNTNRTTGKQQSDSETMNTQRTRNTGRMEAPQDMLDRARDYIVRTNAFLWLVDQLEVCFMGVYEW